MEGSNLRLRSGSSTDISLIAELLDTCSQEYLGRATTQEEVGGRLAMAGSDPAFDSLLVSTSDEALLGFGHLWLAGDEDVRFFARVRPSARGRGVGSSLVTRLERRAHELAGRNPARLSTTTWARDETAPRLLSAARFSDSRYFQRMSRTLEGFAETPRWPAGITVRSFRAGADERALFDAFCEAFAGHVGHEKPDWDLWWYDHRDDPRANFDASLWLLAWDGENLGGFVLGRLEGDDAQTGYVAQIGVRGEWSGRGLGYALLLASFGEFQRRGAERATLDVDTENTTSALRLYRKAGMDPTPSFVLWSKPIETSEPAE